jgi:hypothetical protein
MNTMFIAHKIIKENELWFHGKKYAKDKNDFFIVLEAKQIRCALQTNTWNTKLLHLGLSQLYVLTK